MTSRLILDTPRKSSAQLSTANRLDTPAPQRGESLSKELWARTQDVAQEALGSTFIQGIKHGSLDPNSFGQYTIQDAVYCYQAQRDYEVLASRITRPDLKAFVEARRDGYAKYNQQTFALWHIREPNALSLSPAAKAYSDFESMVAANDEPLYAIVAMIPCERLWSWLANQMIGDAGPGNLYSFWITGNTSDTGACRLEAFVDAHAHHLDEGRALSVYRTCMLGECNFFRSACKQDPLLLEPARITATA
ncbi:TenA family transcriptional regulator [Stigmatella aurantiaca]|uniref:Tena/thi-4 family n=1 Tax=Stigmatella aurantiaca (strain DW4/3-1) TaxID=378806 RepID=Q091K6_STIAD|nr:TenA family transcriptional regulator [Stigmatella aurantiaca]ADO68875.1 Putative transcription activator [Stigmatella aurantiaca DW4/3-1]EAU66422.1 tena/thi-4 family [Stigmatella aurantiaca DW4/3-1]